MVAEPDRVADVLPPVRHQVVRLEVAENRAVHLGAGQPGRTCRTPPPRRTLWLNRRRISSVGGPTISARSSRRCCPDRGSGLGDEDVPLLELDVVGDRVRPRALRPDLTAVARRDAVGRRLLAAVRRTERREHRERGVRAGRRPASASVAPGRVYCCRSRCACSHQRALSRISEISASLLRTIMLSTNGASGSIREPVTSLSGGPE